MELIQILYIVSGFVAIGAGVPQMLRLFATKNSDGFSISTWAMWVGTQSIAAIYMITLGEPLAIIVAVSWAVFYIVMLVLIIHYYPKQHLKGLQRPLAPPLTSQTPHPKKLTSDVTFLPKKSNQKSRGGYTLHTA